MNEQSIEHDSKIKEDMLKSYEENKLRRQSVQNQEQYTRESVSRHINDRIKRIKLNKSVDSEVLIKKADHEQQ